MMRRFLPLALLLPASAIAWNPTGLIWFLTDMPIPYEISDYVEDSLPEGETISVVNTSYARWQEAAPCAQIDVEYTGTTTENTGFELEDQFNRFTWDDPYDNHGVGVLGVTSYDTVAEYKVIQGIQYTHLRNSDIVFNDNVLWGTEEQTEDPNCSGRTSVTAVAVHEIGHWWGLDHTCEATDPCTDPLDAEATMYYAAGACDNHSAFPNPDDVEGITTLYGPSTQIQCSHEVQPGETGTIATGVVPMDIRCRVTQRGDDTFSVNDASWFFGDGTDEVVGLDAEHTYNDAGTFTVSAVVTGTSDACGDWESEIVREAYVRVCGVPEVGMSVDHIDGRRFQLVNETDLSATGCIYRVQWDIFDPSGALEASIPTWEPEYEFLMNGEYRLVLNVGGPAGTAAHELHVNVRNRRGGAGTCDSAGGAGALGAFALLLPLAIRRRRQ
ncbi:MAG: matrixin family metalloprotease [Deltaproteobacteria bacterium]|nr:MAG: matrixin family metalloprotease [Deltaproteobacteria bacterium]